MGHKLLLGGISTDHGILQEGQCSPDHCEQTDYLSDELILSVLELIQRLFDTQQR